MADELEKRTWVYVAEPDIFEIAGCPNVGHDHKVTWSEYKGHLWCPDCQIDFIPRHGGLFDGPVSPMACKLMGISLDRLIIGTGKIDPFNYEKGQWESELATEVADGATGISR
jgi:hypothetical protein